VLTPLTEYTRAALLGIAVFAVAAAVFALIYFAL
jgi:hypothetical protein